MADQELSEWFRRSLIGKNAHETYAVTKLFSACSSTAITCSREIPSNHSTKSSTVAPASIFSNSARTGTRLSLKTQAPPRRSGSRSTAAHDAQSNMWLGYIRQRRQSRLDGSGLIFRTFAAGGHFYDSWVELSDHIDEVGLGGHHFVDVFVDHGDLVEAGAQEFDAALL